MQAWDFHTLTEVLEEASTCVWNFWKIICHLMPIIGWHKTFSYFDQGPNLLMEVSNNKVLKDFCQHNKVTWCYMVNSGMAIIQTEKGLETLDDINKFLEERVLHNKAQQKAKVRDGACYVERVVLSQYYFGLKEFQELQSQGQLKDRVIWERFSEFHDVDGSMGQSGSSNQADSDTEVVVTLQNWP